MSTFSLLEDKVLVSMRDHSNYSFERIAQSLKKHSPAEIETRYNSLKEYKQQSAIRFGENAPHYDSTPFTDLPNHPQSFDDEFENDFEDLDDQFGDDDWGLKIPDEPVHVPEHVPTLEPAKPKVVEHMTVTMNSSNILCGFEQMTSRIKATRKLSSLRRSMSADTGSEVIMNIDNMIEQLKEIRDAFRH